MLALRISKIWSGTTLDGPATRSAGPIGPAAQQQCRETARFPKDRGAPAPRRAGASLRRGRRFPLSFRAQPVQRLFGLYERGRSSGSSFPAQADGSSVRTLRHRSGSQGDEQLHQEPSYPKNWGRAEPGGGSIGLVVGQRGAPESTLFPVDGLSVQISHSPADCRGANNVGHIFSVGGLGKAIKCTPNNRVTSCTEALV